MNSVHDLISDFFDSFIKYKSLYDIFNQEIASIILIKLTYIAYCFFLKEICLREWELRNIEMLYILSKENKINRFSYEFLLQGEWFKERKKSILAFKRVCTSE